MNVVFDFDKTLTRKDTTRSLFFFLARQNRQRPWAYVWFYFLFKLGLWDERRFKSALVNRFLCGRQPDETRSAAGAFLEGLRKDGMNEMILAALRRHIADGDRVFLASANFDFLIGAFCAAEGVSDHFATTLEVTSDRYNGEISGPILKGAAKLAVLESKFGKDGLLELKFYGDSEDKILFEAIPDHVEV